MARKLIRRCAYGSTVTSDAGLLAYRELDNALGLTRTAVSGLLDTRIGQNTHHRLLALLRQSLYSRLADYEDVNDAEHYCHDPTMRIVAGPRIKQQPPPVGGVAVPRQLFARILRRITRSCPACGLGPRRERAGIHPGGKIFAPDLSLE